MNTHARAPDVTVILPVYNVGPYIVKTMQSLIDQEHPAASVIVVDDCSTDDTHERLSSMGVPGLKILSNETNRGPWYSRNRALDAVETTYVTFIDGDDWYRPTRLRRLVEVAEQHDADLVFDDMDCFDDSGTRHLRTSLSVRRVTAAGPTPLCATDFIRWDLGVMKPLIRMSLIEQHRLRFNGEMRSGSDFSLFARALLLGGRGILLPEAHYAYRFRAGQITADRTKLFVGTEVANDEARAVAVSLGDAAAVEALDRRADKIRSQRTLNDVLVSLRQRKLGQAMRHVAANPGALRMLAKKATNLRLLREKMILRRV